MRDERERRVDLVMIMSETADSGQKSWSNLSQTFSLLSRYLKENGELRTPPGVGRRNQLSIFYGGQVVVVDDFPPHKAIQIMMLAHKQHPHPHPHPHPPLQPLVSGIAHLPIARKASLARFLEKRKQRIRARAEYLENQNPSKQ